MICVLVWRPQDPGLSHNHHTQPQHDARTFGDSIGNSQSGSTNTLEVRCTVSACAYLQGWVSLFTIFCRNTVNCLGLPRPQTVKNHRGARYDWHRVGGCGPHLVNPCLPSLWLDRAGCHFGAEKHLPLKLGNYRVPKQEEAPGTQ